MIDQEDVHGYIKMFGYALAIAGSLAVIIAAVCIIGLILLKTGQ